MILFRIVLCTIVLFLHQPTASTDYILVHTNLHYIFTFTVECPSSVNLKAQYNVKLLSWLLEIKNTWKKGRIRGRVRHKKRRESQAMRKNLFPLPQVCESQFSIQRLRFHQNCLAIVPGSRTESKLSPPQIPESKSSHFGHHDCPIFSSWIQSACRISCKDGLKERGLSDVL